MQKPAHRWLTVPVPGHTVATVDGIQSIFSGCPVAFFNVALLTARGISADA